MYISDCMYDCIVYMYTARVLIPVEYLYICVQNCLFFHDLILKFSHSAPCASRLSTCWVHLSMDPPLSSQNLSFCFLCCFYFVSLETLCVGSRFIFVRSQSPMIYQPSYLLHRYLCRRAESRVNMLHGLILVERFQNYIRHTWEFQLFSFSFLSAFTLQQQLGKSLDEYL